MAALHSLTRANGWGSAGQCLATHSAKTPAVRESVGRVAAVEGAAATTPSTTYLPDASALLILELAELRAAARRYYDHSDLTTLTLEGVEVADRLARLLRAREKAA